MITITFDEQGDFENTHTGGHVFIAGFLYDDFGIVKETENERKRIYRYYSRVCEKAGTQYPSDLHVNNAGDNRSQVALTKTIVNRTLGSFLKDGVYLDPEENDTQADSLGMNARKGRYYLFMKLRSEKGKKELLAQDTSRLMKDSYASNLYIHMAEEIIEETLLYNPFIEKIDEVFFDLPTRLAVTDACQAAQYKTLGHLDFQRINEEVGDGKYQIGNADIYRTAFDLALKNSDKNIQVKEFNVFPIQYKNNNGNMQSFLHLADSLCSLIGYQPSDEKPGEWISEVRHRFNDLAGHSRNLVFAYDETDIYWQKAYKELKSNHLYEALSLVFEGRKCASSMVPYYTDTWYQLIVNRIISCKDLPVLTQAAEKLQESTYSGSIDQEQLLECFEILEKAIVPFENQKEAAGALSALYDAGAAAYNHTGQPEKAIACRKKAVAASKGQDISRSIRMRNRLAVAYCDQLEFEKALETVSSTIEYEKMITEMQMEMNEDESLRTPSEGRALSQRAQIYAFMRDERAEADFLEALDQLSYNEADYLITMSYLLHYYLDTENREKYEKYAEIYFRSNDLSTQFKNLVNDGAGKETRINLKFSLFIFVKAIWTFYRDSLGSQLKTALLNIETALVNRRKEAKDEIGGHPWELIYKYLAFYAYHINSRSKAQDYIEKSQTILNHAGDIIEMINANTLEEYERLKNNEDIIDPDSPLTYMYR